MARGVPHPVLALLDLPWSWHDASAPAGAAPRASSPRAQAPRPGRLVFAVLDAVHGEVIECHELPTTAQGVAEWSEVLDALDAAGRLLWARVERPSRGER